MFRSVNSREITPKEIDLIMPKYYIFENIYVN